MPDSTITKEAQMPDRPTINDVGELKDLLQAQGLELGEEITGSRSITLNADELDILRSGRGSIDHDGVSVFFD